MRRIRVSRRFLSPFANGPTTRLRNLTRTDCDTNFGTKFGEQNVSVQLGRPPPCTSLLNQLPDGLSTFYPPARSDLAGTTCSAACPVLSQILKILSDVDAIASVKVSLSNPLSC